MCMRIYHILQKIYTYLKRNIFVSVILSCHFCMMSLPISHFTLLHLWFSLCHAVCRLIAEGTGSAGGSSMCGPSTERETHCSPQVRNCPLFSSSLLHWVYLEILSHFAACCYCNIQCCISKELVVASINSESFAQNNLMLSKGS